MDEPRVEPRTTGRWRKWIDITQSASIIALAVSLLSFYRSYFYVNQELAVTVTEVSYGTNRGELYMTVAFKRWQPRRRGPAHRAGALVQRHQWQAGMETARRAG